MALHISLTSEAALSAEEPVRQRSFASRLFSAPQVAGSHLHLLDVIRGFAALIVIIWHYQHFFYAPGATRAVAGFRDQQPFYEQLTFFYEHGAYAVQLFWVISGFVFAHVYQGRRSTTRGFIVNRVARLYPLHLLTLLIVAGLQAIAQARFGEHLVYQANSLGNFLLQLGLASNWWPTVVYSFNAPIWSVSIELLVYALFWMILPVLFRGGVVIPALLAGGCLFASFHLEGYILVTCAACFFGGAGMFALHSARSNCLAWLMVFLLGWAGFAGWGDSLDVRRYLGVPLFCMAIVLGAVLIEQEGGASLWRRFRWLGDASYGIYLWHFPVQLVLLLSVPGLATDHIVARSPAFLILFLCLVVALAAASYRYFEKPARNWVRGRFEAPAPLR